MYCGCPRTDRVDIWTCLFEQARTVGHAQPLFRLDQSTSCPSPHPLAPLQLMAKVESTDDNLYDGTSSFSLSITVLTSHTQASMAMNSKKTLQFLLLATPPP